MSEGELKKRIIHRGVTFYSNVAMMKKHEEADKRRGGQATIYRVVDLEEFAKIRTKDEAIIDEAKKDFYNMPLYSSADSLTEMEQNAIKYFYQSEVLPKLKKWFGDSS